MRTHISLTPAVDAGVYIQEKIQEHKDSPILFLVSGGSSFSILEHISESVLNASITIAITDERYTDDQNGNNFSLLTKTAFYKKASAQGVQFIHSLKMEGESHVQFTDRIENKLREFRNTHPNAYGLGIFGIGEDGHTAGIFPASENEFIERYEVDSYYVSLVQKENTYPKRSTVTPLFIEEVLNDIVMFAVGSNKCDNILNYMHNKSFSRFQIPALIPARHPHSILFTDCETLI